MELIRFNRLSEKYGIQSIFKKKNIKKSTTYNLYMAKKVDWELIWI